MSTKGFRTGLVTQLVGLSYKQIDHYDRDGIVQPEIQKASGRGSRRLYSRTNLIELMVLKRILDRGVSLAKIRRSLKEARKRYPSSKRPLYDLTFRTDGRSIYIDDTESGTPIDLLNPDQPVIPIAIENIAGRIDHAIEQYEDHRIESVQYKGRSYLVEIVNDTESTGCVARCPGLLGVSVKGANLDEALQRMRERIKEALAQLSPGKQKPSDKGRGKRKSGKKD